MFRMPAAKYHSMPNFGSVFQESLCFFVEVSQPTTTTTHVSRSGGLGEGTFSQRFEDMRKDFFTTSQQASQSASSRGESRSVRTFTVTEGVGPNKVQGLMTISEK